MILDKKDSSLEYFVRGSQARRDRSIGRDE
jgi:hypothetical protein